MIIPDTPIDLGIPILDLRATYNNSLKAGKKHHEARRLLSDITQGYLSPSSIGHYLNPATDRQRRTIEYRLSHHYLRAYLVKNPLHTISHYRKYTNTLRILEFRTHL